MTLPRSLLEAYAAHVADENAKADRALAASRGADDSMSRAVLLNDSHEHRLQARVWREAYDLAEPHAHFPRQVRLGSPGDGEGYPGDDEVQS